MNSSAVFNNGSWQLHHDLHSRFRRHCLCDHGRLPSRTRPRVMAHAEGILVKPRCSEADLAGIDFLDT